VGEVEPEWLPHLIEKRLALWNALSAENDKAMMTGNYHKRLLDPHMASYNASTDS
jgi:hypothetical protein